MYLGEEFKFKPSTELIEEELLLIEMPLFAKSRAYQCAYGYSGSRPYKLAYCLAGSLLSMRQHILHCDSRGFKHWFDTWFVPLLMQGRKR